MENLNRIVIGSENGNSLVAKPYDSLSERIVYDVGRAYHTIKGLYHTAAEHTKKVGYATIDRLVSEYKTRKDDATLLPFDYSTGMNYDSLSDKVYNHLRDVWGSASEKIRNLISPYSGLPGPYSTVKAREYTQSKHKKGGFTLTELLVTISATTLLMAILMPALQRARNQARAVVCQSNLRQMKIIFDAHEENLLNTTLSPPYVLWWNYIKSFPDDGNGVLLCPRAKKLGTQINPIWWNGSKFTAWARSKTSNYEPVSGSYGFNNRLVCGFQKSRNWFEKNTSVVPLLFDCALPLAAFWSSDNPPPQYDDISVADTNDNDPGSRICINRHDGGIINMLFADYSVRKVGLKEPWTLKWHEDFCTTGPWTKAGGVKPEDWPKWMRNFKDY